MLVKLCLFFMWSWPPNFNIQRRFKFDQIFAAASEVERLFMDKSQFNARASSESLDDSWNNVEQGYAAEDSMGDEYCNNSFNDSSISTLKSETIVSVVPTVPAECIFSGDTNLLGIECFCNLFYY